MRRSVAVSDCGDDRGEGRDKGRALPPRDGGEKLRPRRTRGALANRQHFFALRSEPDGIDARILFGAPALQQTSGDETAHQFGSSRSINPGGRHDRGLTEAVGIGDRLQDGELSRRKGVVADLTREKIVGALSGTVQQMQR